MSAIWDWGDTVSLQREIGVVDLLSSASGYGARGVTDEVRPRETVQIVGEPATFTEAQDELTKARAKATSCSYTLVGGETVTGFITGYNRERLKESSLYKITLTLETSTVTLASDLTWQWVGTESLTRELTIFDEMPTSIANYGDRVFYDNKKPTETVQIYAEPLTDSDATTIRTAARARGTPYAAAMAGGGSVTGYITRYQRELVKGSNAYHKVTLELLRTDI